MKKYIQGAILDIAGLPKGVVSRTEKIGDTYITVVAEKQYIDGVKRFSLPGASVLEDNQNNVFSVFGVETPEFKALVVLDKTIDLEKGITKEDIEYFGDLENFNISCNLRMRELNIEELFRPIETLIHSDVISETSSFVEYKSAINGKSVFVKPGSNRQRFINGQNDFLDDPFDFYDYKDITVLPNEIEHYAAIKNSNEFVYMFDRINEATLKACLTIFSSSNMRMIAKKAIELRNTVTSKLSAETYWDEFIEQPARLSKYSDIDWEKVSIALSKAKDTDAGFNTVSHLIAVEADAYSWGPYTVHIFFIFYMLLEDDKIDFIKNTFNL